MAGFRAGKAPDFLSLRDVPQDKLLSKAAELSRPLCLSEAVKSIKEEPLHFSSQPHIEIKQLKREQLVLYLTYPYFPSFLLPDFSAKDGIKLENLAITREDLAFSTLKLAKPLGQKLEYISVDKIAYHDTVAIDFEVGLEKSNSNIEEQKTNSADSTINKEGEKGENNKGTIEIVIGSGMLLPTIERKIIGMEVGKEDSFDIVFPEFYPKLNFRNKAGFFRVKVLAIKRSKFPEIKLEDLPKLGFKEGATFEDLNIQIERFCQAEKIDLARNIFRRDLLATYLSKITINFSEFQILTNQRFLLERFLSGLEANKITIEDYLRDTGGTKESIFDELRSETIKGLKTQALLEKIIEEKKIGVSDSEILEYKQLLSSFYNKPLEEVEKSFPYEQLTSLIIDQKLINYLVEICDPEGAKNLKEYDFFLLGRSEEAAKQRTPLEKLHSVGKSLFKVYPLENKTSS